MLFYLGGYGVDYGSKKSRPKQYLPFFSGETLFQKTVNRNRDICDKITVVGNKDDHLLSRKDLGSLGQTIYSEIIEACPRNTAAAIAFAAFHSNPDDILFVTPSVHLIGSDGNYKDKINRRNELAEKGYIVTFGLKPTKPETGFGYLEAIEKM